MKLSLSRSIQAALGSAFIIFCSLTSAAQSNEVRARVTQAVDVENRVTLRGGTHPLARPEWDRGGAPDSLPVGHILLVLQRVAEQERQALHTEIHKYVVNGEEHWANASAPQIPVALAPVVAGIVSLHNFPKKPTFRRLGTFSRSKATNELKPLSTY